MSVAGVELENEETILLEGISVKEVISLQEFFNRFENKDFDYKISLVWEKSDTQKEIFEILKTLGKGATGFVFLALNRNKLVALRLSYEQEDFKAKFDSIRISMGDDYKKYFLNILFPSFQAAYLLKGNINKEIKISFNRTVNVSTWETADSTLDGQFAEDFKNKLDWFLDFLKGLRVIHKRGRVHFDLKLENLFLIANHLKIGDFEFYSKVDEFISSDRLCGTPGHIAPEMFYDRKNVTPNVDIFSAGISFAKLFLGESFKVSANGLLSYDEKGELEELFEGKLFSFKNEELSNAFRLNFKIFNFFRKRLQVLLESGGLLEEEADIYKILLQMLEVQPGKRPSIKEILSRVYAAIEKAKRRNNRISQHPSGGRESIEPDGATNGNNENSPKPGEHREPGKDVVKVKPKWTLRRWRQLITITSLGSIASILAFVLFFYNPIKSCNDSNLQYWNNIESTKRNIESCDYPKAEFYLKIAEGIEKTDLTNRLFREIETGKMRKAFDVLKVFLDRDVPKSEKLRKCQEFLKDYQSLPPNKDTQLMLSETRNMIKQLESALAVERQIVEEKADEQYRNYIEAVKRFINSGDYDNASLFLKKAKRIKDTEEVKRLSETISKKQQEKIDLDKKNGDNDYNSIKDKLDLNKYLDFKGKYPNSIHLPDLKGRLKAADKVLPPEKYWDRPIRKNIKGYYEFKFIFGNEMNEHRMIYIPEKKIWIDKYEVSWSQFRKISTREEENVLICNDAACPAVVEYNEARAYCKKYGLRLPTESAWEYAAGIGGRIYPWGDELPSEDGIYRANFYEYSKINRERKGVYTVRVNEFEDFISPFGVVNMAGNVWEWLKEENRRKGGGFLSSEEDMRIETRAQKNSGKNGFRCIKVELPMGEE